MWDGKFRDLEDQVLAPVENPLEMKNNWEEVERRLRNHDHYPALFRKAFGINSKAEITKELAAKAISQFMLNLKRKLGSWIFPQVFVLNIFKWMERKEILIF